jgi:methionyl aminopeptidase
MINPQDLITLDLVVAYKGWHADTARTFTLNNDPIKRQFVKASSMIFQSALEAIAPLQPINLFGMMVEEAARLKGYGVIQNFCGHGIGQSIHMDPQVPNYHTPTQDVFEIGRSYAVEPVLAIESQYELYKDTPDGWTAVINCLASHNEDTVFISDSGVINLTDQQ